MCFYFILLRKTSITINNRVSFYINVLVFGYSVIRPAVLGSAASGRSFGGCDPLSGLLVKKKRHFFWFELSGTGC